MMTDKVKVGDKAPDFTLPDTELKPRSLKEFLGNKTVLAFFVGAFTSVCTKEMCAFRVSMARLTNLKAQIVGIAVTAPFSNKAFAEKNMLPFPILSDYKREIIQTYGIELRLLGTQRLHDCEACHLHLRQNGYSALCVDNR